jgi:membrane protein DedA with SNARE-associated domain
MGQLAEGLLSLSGWAALTLLFTLPALEAPAFLGLILPGELALLLGGVLAHQDRIPLAGALAVGVAGALAGDTAGYWIGRRWGPRLLTSGLGRRVEGLLLRGGGWALVVGRCTAGARVVLPGLAGMLGLRYRTFAAWTGVAATVWAAAHVLLGYAAGAGWRHIHQLTGRIGLGLALTVVVALAVAWLLRRRARGHQDEPRQPVAAGWRRA